jgi:hypothetical protein
VNRKVVVEIKSVRNISTLGTSSNGVGLMLLTEYANPLLCLRNFASLASQHRPKKHEGRCPKWLQRPILIGNRRLKYSERYLSLSCSVGVSFSSLVVAVFPFLVKSMQVIRLLSPLVVCRCGKGGIAS